MRTPISRIERITGGFLVFVTGIVALALLGVGPRKRLIRLLRKDVYIYAKANQGFGAVEGSPVRVRGVEVGTVTAVNLTHDGKEDKQPVRITIKLRPDALEFLKNKTVAIIVRPPLGSGMPPFGTSSVALESHGDSPLLAGATISTKGQPSMLENFARMSTDVRAVQKVLVASLSNLQTTFANLEIITEHMLNGKGMAGRMLSDESLGKDIDVILTDARRATQQLQLVLKDTRRVTRGAPALMADAKNASKEGTRLLRKLNRTVDSLPAILAATGRTLAVTEELMRSLKGAAIYAPRLARKVDTSIEEANRLVAAAQKNFVLRATLPDAKRPKTSGRLRPPIRLPRAKAPKPASSR